MRSNGWVVAAVLLVLGCMPGDGSRLLGIGGSGGGGGSGSVALAFAVQPAGANEDDIITPAIQIVARDSLGNTDVTFTGTVTVALGNNPTGAFLLGTKTIPAVFGVASFGDLAVDRPGSGCTLSATAVGATTAKSGAFNIVSAP